VGTCEERLGSRSDPVARRGRRRCLGGRGVPVDPKAERDRRAAMLGADLPALPLTGIGR
jgi:hypothetical protein